MASVDTYLEKYLRELQEIRSSGEATGETSHYPPLRELLNSVGDEIKPKVRCVLTLKNRGAGLPDGGLFTKDQFQKPRDAEPLPGQKPGRGAIEVKSTSDDAWVTADSEQVTKYWREYGQVLVTNYRDFVLLGRDAEALPSSWHPTASPGMKRLSGAWQRSLTGTRKSKASGLWIF